MRTRWLCAPLVLSLASFLTGCGESSSDNDGVVAGAAGMPGVGGGAAGAGDVGGAPGAGMPATGGMGGVGGDIGGTGSGGAPGGTGGAGAPGQGGTSGEGGASGGAGSDPTGAGAAGGAGGVDPVGGTDTGGTDTGGTDTGGTDTGGTDTGGTDTGTDGITDETETTEPPTGDGEFLLTSAELTEGGEFPEAHTCAASMDFDSFGDPISLSWSGYPDETQSFALAMVDVTLAESGTMNAHLGYHSAFWNLPVSETSLPVDSWAAELTGAQTINGGYLGPCPAFGGDPPPPHTYVFTLYAFSDATITISGGTDSLTQAIIDQFEEKAIAKTTLSGISCANLGNWEACASP